LFLSGLHLVWEDTLQGCTDIAGVTQLDGLLFAACRNSPTLLIYKRHPVSSKFQPIDNVTGRWTNPLDIASSAASNNLYVLDFSSTYHIWRANVGNCHEWIEFLPGIVVRAFSVILNGDLLLLNSQGLHIYSLDVVHKRTYGLPRGIGIPNYALAVSKDRFLISYEHQTHSGVSETGQVGQITRSVKCAASNSEQGLLLKDPQNMIQDSEGRIFVSCYKTNQVIVLDSELKCGHVILNGTRDEIIQPNRLSYDSSSNTLVVGQHWQRNNIRVYKVVQK